VTKDGWDSTPEADLALGAALGLDWTAEEWAESRKRCRELAEEVRRLGGRLRLVTTARSGEPLLAVIDWDHGGDNILPEEGDPPELVAALHEWLNGETGEADPVDAQPERGPHD
jgi:hypothetical protein